MIWPQYQQSWGGSGEQWGRRPWFRSSHRTGEIGQTCPGTWPTPCKPWALSVGTEESTKDNRARGREEPQCEGRQTTPTHKEGCDPKGQPVMLARTRRNRTLCQLVKTPETQHWKAVWQVSKQRYHLTPQLTPRYPTERSNNTHLHKACAWNLYTDVHSSTMHNHH